MRDLSLHVLDILENSLRAGARRVRVTLAADPATDRLVFAVEDDGPGFPVPPERLLDPFFTTKADKHTGLGLSLLRDSAEAAAGRLRLGRSPDLGGALVEATMQLRHVDRRPLGDVAATMFSVLCADPDLELECCLASPAGTVRVATADLRPALGGAGPGFALARAFVEPLREGLAALTALEEQEGAWERRP